MNREKKKQIMALFILFMFVGSSLAFAIISVTREENKQEVRTVFDRPLENSEEAPFLQQNYVIVKYFWSEACADCDLAEQALNDAKSELKGRLVIEKINVAEWANYTEDLSVTSVPFFYLKGRTVVTGAFTDSDALVRAVCPLYFYGIEECAFLS
ncbi:MAG: thioredoxin domain-containing protein [Candidatus Aenigmatarchaeota archaeon]